LSEVVDNPRYSTGIGLLLMGKGQLEKEMMNQIDGNSINQIFMKMKNWFQGNF
jgi:cell division protein FtsA